MTRMWRTAILVGAWSVAVAAQAPAQEKDDKAPKDEARPEIGLKVSPLIAFSPAKISVRAELKGGALDYEPFYCNTIVWDWDDGTTSENTPDCPPYEAGQSRDPPLLQQHAHLPDGGPLQRALPDEEGRPHRRWERDARPGAARHPRCFGAAAVVCPRKGPSSPPSER